MIENGTDAESMQLRVLVRGATARDDAMTKRELERAGITVTACPDLDLLLHELRLGAGALLLAEEALADSGARALFQHVIAQPPWSDLPVLILARQGADSPVISDALAVGANVTVLERPIRVAALISAVHSALRGRSRQYELRGLLDGLRDSDQRKTEFLATLAHELRNPLAPIRTCVGILQRSPPDPSPVLAVMERQVHHMVRLVDDLLELSRITRGLVELRPVDVELATIVTAARETSQPRIDAGGHFLELRLTDRPLWLRADPVRLAQVLSNLLNNAARYTNDGGRILLEAQAEGGEAVVRVTDNGVGISEEVLPGVFDMFSQADSRDIRAQHGLGIGLALVRNLVEMHGGTVSASSAGAGLGSSFEIRLPLARAPRFGVGAAQTSDETPPLPKRILVVDDNRDAADTLAALLGMAGAEVEVAYDGMDALARVEAFRPQVAVLDLGMPGMSGLDVARRIREAHAEADCALVALTGWGQATDRQMTEEAGFRHHLTKPVDFDEMCTVLSSLR